MLSFNQFGQSQWQSSAIFGLAGGANTRFPTFLPRTSLTDTGDSSIYHTLRATHRILAVLLDDIEMLRDRFMEKQEEKPKVGDGFRSVVGTGAWQELKETAVVKKKITKSHDFDFTSSRK
jgi:hypothetical protein